MRAVLVGGPGRVTVIDPPDPTPGPGEVIVEVSSRGRCGRCGTDPRALDGQLPSAYRALTPGREGTGHVVARGAGVTGPPVGTRVAGDPGDTPCATCHDGRTGRGDLWRDYRADGSMNRFRSTTDPLASRLAPAPQVGAISTLDGFDKAVAAVRTGTGRTISVAPTEVAQA